MATLLFLLIPSKSIPKTQIEVAFPNLTFDQPVDLQHPPDGSNRLFVVERAGRILVFENNPNVAEEEVFLDIRDKVISLGSWERGLLGLVFHPNYRDSGYFYVNYSALNPHRTVVSRFKVSENNVDSADVASEFIIIEILQPDIVHYGGQIVFGPDGYLYIARGDGGPGGDPNGHGQNPQTLLGALLRIDVDNPMAGANYGIPADNPFVGNPDGFREEIFAYGLRNPWRFSFDPVTGWLWLADVGQNLYEEINIVSSGENYGWNIMEGFHCYEPPDNCNMTGLTMPILEYDHTGSQSITGGFVYRGAQVPSLYGKYIYADFVDGNVWFLEDDGINPPVNTELFNMGSHSVTSFGVDENYELYLCSWDGGDGKHGKIYRLTETLRVGEDKIVPEAFALHQNYPNPFNPSTTIQLNLPVATEVRLAVYDLLGHEVVRLVDRHLEAGYHQQIWNGRDRNGHEVPTGIYFGLVVTPEFRKSIKIVLLK